MSINVASEVDDEINKHWDDNSDSDLDLSCDYSENCDINDDCNAELEETRTFLYRHFSISIVANSIARKPNLVFIKATLLHTKEEDHNKRT